ncbi:MAG: peptidylprolyl isomerase [Armatimonadetes bacterium]|nr:peptidylprolyl isomerase [Armatimonadota bacterium]
MVLTSLALLLAAPKVTPFTGPTITVMMASKKSFVIQTETANSPKTVAQIVGLCNKKFYDGQLVHRVEDWVVQWGDPTSRKGVDAPGVGEGGSGKDLPFEESPVEFKRGIVGIASTGMKVGGDSQIFILTKDAERLTKNYAVLGKVIKGMDVVDGIKRGDKIVSMRAAEIKITRRKKN